MNVKSAGQSLDNWIEQAGDPTALRVSARGNGDSSNIVLRPAGERGKMPLFKVCLGVHLSGLKDRPFSE